MKKFELDFDDDENIKNTIEQNVLNRNEKLYNFIKLIDNINEHFIISLDGSWGCGKTFFLKQMIYLSNHIDDVKVFPIAQQEVIKKFSTKYTVVYYNAWENDDHDNPIESLIYNFLNEYPKKKNHIENEGKIFIIAKPIMINIIDKLSLGIVTKECFEKLTSFSDLAKNISTIEEKKRALNELFDTVLEEDERLLLIVDELDRCKPDYAVKMLETLKHFYNNKKITIIVSTNNSELSSTIKHYYGNDFNGYGYLNKIYDTVINLEVENLENYSKHYCDIVKQTNLPENMSYLLFEYLEFSYRECNKYMSMYNIVRPYTKMTGFSPREKFLVESSMLLPFSLALKIRSIEMFNRFIKGDGENIVKDFMAFVGKIEKSTEYQSWFCDIFEAKNNEEAINKFIVKYKEIMNNKGRYNGFPYAEAISMLGNSVNID